MKFNKNQLNTIEETSLIQDYENGMRKKEILIRHDISRSYLKTILKRNGIKNSYDPRDRFRKYLTQENFFDLINSEEKAYWFGFLLADGYISAKNSNWSVQLRLIDLDAVKKLKNSLNSNIPIKTIHSDKRKTCYELSIASKYMVQSLAKHGLISNKTFRVHIPETIPKELWHHVVRGYFDGDGCIYIRKNGKINCSITSGSPKIILQIENFLKEKGIIRKEKSFTKNYRTYQTLTIEKQLETKQFLDFIYGESTIHLDRKYKKYQSIKNLPLTHIRVNATSKYRGVRLNRQSKTKLFCSGFSLNKQRFFLGNFPTEIEAAKAYNQKVLELGLSTELLNNFS